MRRKSSIRIVACDERGPTISSPTSCTLCSASRRAMKVERSRSLRGPSSYSSARSTSRSTAMYRRGWVTTAVRNAACPERRLSSPRNFDVPWRTISWPAGSRIATSPSTMAMNG